jgi:integrase
MTMLASSDSGEKNAVHVKLSPVRLDRADHAKGRHDRAARRDDRFLGQKIIARAGDHAKLGFPIRPPMLRHACGFKLANEGHDTRAIQRYLGHRNIQHTVRYTELAADRFKRFWSDQRPTIDVPGRRESEPHPRACSSRPSL